MPLLKRQEFHITLSRDYPGFRANLLGLYALRLPGEDEGICQASHHPAQSV
jgi:hypothetical protein